MCSSFIFDWLVLDEAVIVIVTKLAWDEGGIVMIRCWVRGAIGKQLGNASVVALMRLFFLPIR